MESTIKTFIHETNNMLFRVVASTQILEKSDNLSDKDKEKIKIIFDSTVQISKMVEELSKDYNLYDFKK